MPLPPLLSTIYYYTFGSGSQVRAPGGGPSPLPATAAHARAGTTVNTRGGEGGRPPGGWGGRGCSQRGRGGGGVQEVHGRPRRSGKGLFLGLWLLFRGRGWGFVGGVDLVNVTGGGGRVGRGRLEERGRGRLWLWLGRGGGFKW